MARGYVENDFHITYPGPAARICVCRSRNAIWRKSGGVRVYHPKSYRRSDRDEVRRSARPGQSKPVRHG